MKTTKEKDPAEKIATAIKRYILFVCAMGLLSVALNLWADFNQYWVGKQEEWQHAAQKRDEKRRELARKQRGDGVRSGFFSLEFDSEGNEKFTMKDPWSAPEPER